MHYEGVTARPNWAITSDDDQRFLDSQSDFQLFVYE